MVERRRCGRQSWVSARVSQVGVHLPEAAIKITLRDIGHGTDWRKVQNTVTDVITICESCF